MRGAQADGKKIRRLRKIHGLTQEDLAGLAGCDVKTIRNAEHEHTLDFCTLGRIAAALEVTFAAIVVDNDGAAVAVQERIRIVKRFWSAFQEQDIDLLMGFFARDAVVRLPGAPEIPFAGEYRGTVAIRRLHEVAFAVAKTEAVADEQISFTGSGEYVVIHGAARMISKTNGATAVMAFSHVFHFNGLAIDSMSASYDSLEMHKALAAPARRLGRQVAVKSEVARRNGTAR